MSFNKKQKSQWKDASDITDDQLKMLENFVKLVKFNYNILDFSSLKFFKDWLENE